MSNLNMMLRLCDWIIEDSLRYRDTFSSALLENDKFDASIYAGLN